MFEVIAINSKTNTRTVVAPAATQEAGDKLAVRFTFTEGNKNVSYVVEPRKR